MQLLINSGGYARLNKLNEQQRQEIRNSRPKPKEETSTRSPYKEVDPKKRRVEPEISLFKKSFNESPPSQRTLDQRNRVNKWVEEQLDLGQNLPCTTTGMILPWTPNKIKERRNESIPKPIISTREQGSQVEEECLNL